MYSLSIDLSLSLVLYLRASTLFGVWRLQFHIPFFHLVLAFPFCFEYILLALVLIDQTWLNLNFFPMTLYISFAAFVCNH